MTKIPTRRSFIKRAIDAADTVTVERAWLPAALFACALLMIVNYPI